MILLDTDSLSLHLFGHQRLLARVQAASEVPAITVVTQLEVLRGRAEALLKAADAEQLLRAQQGLFRSREHLAVFRIIPFDSVSAAEFDQLRMIKKLKKIGRADLLIASIARAHRATLVTRNVRDFCQVPGLQVVNWID
ncbi:MAG TPA: type II toxin-antitoxin system VapC family toxin [Gemmataceae bacterium]|nr:type II toxin-antitoxin system VapC family toxin [Gemmataceae bacterium]